MSNLGLERLPGRCADGYAQIQHPQLCQCGHVPALKTAGIDAANAGAPASVKERIDAEIRRLAATGRDFSANDMRAALHGVSGPAVGGRFNTAARRGVIRATGARVPSNLGSTHGHELKVWRGAAA